MKVSLRDARGFSLVELMVVVAIIGILAAIAVPNFQRFTQKSKQSEAKSALSAVYSAMRAFQTEWGSYFTDFRNIGYMPQGQIRYAHGFGAAGVGLPAGYQGAGITTAGGAAVQFTANAALCAIAPYQCVVLPGPGGAAPTNPVAGATSLSASTFIAEAQADIDGDAAQDIWRINEQKLLQNTGQDIN